MRRRSVRPALAFALSFGLAAVALGRHATQAPTALFDQTVADLTADTRSPLATTRATAAENIGYLRAYSAAKTLAGLLKDTAPAVRREAALSLAWCGSRNEVPNLLMALTDPDWTVRQSAWVALTNLTGRELPFDALADDDTLTAQTRAWRTWWDSVPPDAPPANTLRQTHTTGPPNMASGCPVSASSTYRGPPGAITDPADTRFWQTKNVAFPQSCTIDLREPRTIGCVVINQYGPGFCMTDWAVGVSRDGTAYETVSRRQDAKPRLVVAFDSRDVRYVRITSYAGENPVYPTTFRAVEILHHPPQHATVTDADWVQERGLRALGALGGDGANQCVIAAIAPYVDRGPNDTSESLKVQAGIRALGRLATQEGRMLLTRLLRNTHWARYAADALGDVNDTPAMLALIAAYPEYASTLSGKPPKAIPPDDRPGFEAVDRMYETPYAIMAALSRHTYTNDNTRQALRGIAPLLLANLPGDFDGAMLYEREARGDTVAYLLERAGVRREACELAFHVLDPSNTALPVSDLLPPETRTAILALARRSPGGTSTAASWLPVLCQKTDDIARLTGLLSHPDGWVRINAAKALVFLDARGAVPRITELLQASPPEASYGYFGEFLFRNGRKQGQAEYNAPAPRWRECFARALGKLNATGSTTLLIDLLNNADNALEVQYAAATALADLATPGALRALDLAENSHPFHSIRLLARECLWQRNALSTRAPPEAPSPSRRADGTPQPTTIQDEAAPEDSPIVFIQGDNDMPNDFQIDIWRQTYSTTDSGPTYRLGRNLCILRAKGAATNRTASALTRFTDGYVADCEVSYDGRRIVFARRGGRDDPWWHVFEVNAAGSTEPRQLTRGPYHDVQPAYLADGRIIFSSSRTGLRDEYHGYPATGLTVMNADGSDIHCIGFNLGRDNEPAVMPDGRIVFSRLELFYSRLKTELTVQTVFPDGTANRTLYGPERRTFWRDITRASGERWWGEAPPRHRVLRLTQPQPSGNGRVICATTGGATLVGPGRYDERIIPRHANMAITTPYPIGSNRALCAAATRTLDRKRVNLGLYVMDMETGTLTLLYDDPDRADFEPRLLRARPTPPALPDAPRTHAYTARLVCSSATLSREALTQQRGKLLRIVEGQPITARHHTHVSSAGEAWKNHVGTLARVLGTVPLAADGSFHVEVPADRLIHCQVLDSDRRVVGNQQIWMYARPGETRSCVGCHEPADMSPAPERRPYVESARQPPVACLPTGGEFSYRAKVWRKGVLSDEAEERTRTVRAVNLPGRL